MFGIAFEVPGSSAREDSFCVSIFFFYSFYFLFRKERKTAKRDKSKIILQVEGDSLARLESRGSEVRTAGAPEGIAEGTLHVTRRKKILGLTPKK